jgi:thymidylate kinase
MQIELIGSTGAGKSTLTKSILNANSNHDLDIITSYAFVLRQTRTNWIRNHSVRMFLLNFFALFACLLTARKNLKLFQFVIKIINQIPASVSRLEKLKIARIVARNVGIYEIANYYSSDTQIVLADEGTVHIAHYLFVHVSVEPNIHDIETFIQLVSLPDVVVYLKQPGPVLLERTKARRHKRISGNGSINAAEFINNVMTTFELIVQSPRIEGQLLVANGGKCKISAAGSQNNPLLRIALDIVRSGINPIIGE